MKKYVLLLISLLFLCSCTAGKSSTIKYEESRAAANESKKTEQVKKRAVKKEKAKQIEKIVYKGSNEKAEIFYNLSNNILTYRLNAGSRRMLIRSGGLAGLIYINNKTYYTNYSAGKISAKGCIYDSSTKNIVVSPNTVCEINLEITVDDMPSVDKIETMQYKSDLGQFTLYKKTN